MHTAIKFVLGLLFALSSFAHAVNWVSTYGAADIDSFPQIVQTKEGGFAIAGRVFRSEGNAEIRVLKVDALGNIAWQKTFGSGYVFGPSFDRAENGGFFVAGRFLEYSWLLKLDSKGRIQWQKALYFSIGGVRHTRDGGAIVQGEFGGGLCLVRFEENGKIRWQKGYDLAGLGSIGAGLIEETLDDGFVIASETSEIGPDRFGMLKLDRNGNVVWYKILPAEDQGFGDFAQTQDGGFVLAGGVASEIAVIRVVKLDAQ